MTASGTFKIRIAATFTSEPVRPAMELLLDALLIPNRIEFAPFNQVFQELLSPTSSFATNDNGVNVILLRIEDLTGRTNEQDALRRNAHQLIDAFRSGGQRLRVPMILVFCPPSRASLSSFSDLCLCTERELTKELSAIRDLHIIESERLKQCCPVAEYDNPQGHRLGAVPYTQRFYAILGQSLARTVYRLISLPHKVIVLDCDQTLWRGICGEDGPDGIKLDESRRFLQEFMVAQSEAGVLLCICSKNNEADVAEVFAKRSDMPLKPEHIVAWRVNWGPKSENIKSLSRELQLGLDTFIFVDDDPVVCAEVEANCPEVLTVCLPEDQTELVDFFLHHWAFDHLRITDEDRNRTRMYREDGARQELLEKATSLEDFLESLELRCEIAPMESQHLSRVAQLTQRTNQFNATTIRRNESDILQLVNGHTANCLVVHVRDRFGDYGLVGVLIYSARERMLEVDTFLLSCRALGRGVEHRMLSKLGQLAADAGKTHVEVNFVATKRNLPARDFFERTGGAFKQAHEELVVFRYPTEVARHLSHAADAQTPDTIAPSTPPQNGSVGAQGSSRARAAALREIAGELHRTEALLLRLKPAEATRPELGTPYVAPTTETESALIALLEEILSVRPIGVVDDFFELGGDSLLAVSLFVEIKERFGIELLLATLFTAPTVRDLAHLLDGEGQKAEWRHLVPIQPNGSSPPLFCMHAAGGNVLFYRDLSRYLGPAFPVYGVQAREREQTGAYPNRVDEMAADYIQEILQFQTEGPYYLCGSSFGGLLAYEVAQQLKAGGKEIGLLALFDTYGPGYPKRLASSGSSGQRLPRLTARLDNIRSQLRLLTSRGKVQFVKQKAGKAFRLLKRKWLWKKNEFQIRYGQATGRELPKDLQRNHKSIQEALETYLPRPFDGKLTLFRASIQPRGIVPDPLLGWGGLARGGIDLYESPGAHGAMTVDPYAESLAQHLRICLTNTADNGAQKGFETSAMVARV